MIRLSRITIENFKNVQYGQIDLSAEEGRPSILGLYGQNGSGKTSLIEAVELLKALLSGRAMLPAYADYIHVDSPYACVVYEFTITDDGVTDKVSYEVCFSQVRESGEQNPGVDVFKETISVALGKADGSFSRYSCWIDTSSEIQPFGPAGRASRLLGKNKALKTEIEYKMQFARFRGLSSVFCDDFQRVLELRKDLAPGEDEAPENRVVRLIRRLSLFGKQGLFVISKAEIGEISLPSGVIIPMDKSVTLPLSREPQLERVIENMNLVLQEIVPGLSIGYRVLGRELMADTEEGLTLQLISEKNEKAIPLKYESQGIKKIISVLHLLIRVYNQDSITVAIDELDAGIFEYLLGELLRILSDKGRGQLIFTSHNLRPLETINKEFVAFTTTNPMQRYLRMSGVKSAANLRDFYYRDLQLGGQKENLYEPTNNYDIALAFRQAGENSLSAKPSGD
ncbi:MAG: AAA family ATPase [Firmicutes bacterium]|nr:AAA family ATPase [Bacillota bacterium]